MKLFLRYFLLFYVLLVGGCKSGTTNHDAPSESYYTCPMHTTVMSKSPGTCPVCNMSLIKVEKKTNTHQEGKGNFITIEKEAQELAAIETDSVKLRFVYPAPTLVGTVSIDEKLVKTVSSRVKGRIDKLFIKTTGGVLKIGSPLYSIYSEQLFADEKEYLTLIEKAKTSGTLSSSIADLLDVSKSRLLLWGLTEKQLAEVEKLGKPSKLATFYSPQSGYVSNVEVTEGMYVEEGTSLFKITSLNKVWVAVQVYSSEISNFQNIMSFQVFAENNPDEIFQGTLVYNNPMVEEGKKVYLLRIKVDNPKGKLIPGMMVSVRPQLTGKSVMAVPKSAILLEKMKTVWVLAHENTFEQRMVKTGAENEHWVEIMSGLKLGDQVVTEGAYLISSEYILKSGAGQRHNH